MKNLLILAYHRVFPDPRGALAVTPENFELQLRSFLKKGYHALPLKDVFFNYLKDGKPIPKKTLVITFDDGYKDNYTYAMPILKKLNVPATVFLAADYIGRDVTFPWDNADPDLKNVTMSSMDHPLTWEQVKDLQKAGIEFGSHTMTHPKLTHISLHDAWDELYRSKQLIEQKLGVPVYSFCAPHGYLNAALVKLSEKAGYAVGVLNPPGIPGQDAGLPETRYSLRRIGVYSHDTVDRLQLKNSFLFTGFFRTIRTWLTGKKH
jgi:peptidoglycan/xylan/chitin deacetylase (PgdA/CDA1 family)